MGLNNKQKEALQLARNDLSSRKYLFNKLAEAQEPNVWLQSLKEEGYFDAKNNPAPEEVKHQPGFYTIHRWYALGYIENVAIKNRENPKKEITDFLVEFIDDVITREIAEKIDNERTNSTIIQLISCLSQNEITEKHISFIDIIAETKWKSSLVTSKLKDFLIPRLLSFQAKDLLLKLLEIILSFKTDTRDSHVDYKPVFERFWLKKTVDQHSKAIGKLCGVSASRVGIAKIKELSEKDKNEFSIWRIHCIEDHEQRIKDDEYAHLIVDFVRDVLLSAETINVRELLEELLIDDLNILRRIAFHTINHRYDEYGKLFWEIESNPLEMEEQNHEVYELLRNNCKQFSDNQIEQLTIWIETKEYYVSNEAKEAGFEEKVIAYQKKKWFFACIESGKTSISESFNRYDNLSPGKLEHPGWPIWHESHTGVDKSPISVKELLGKENEEIVEYINNCNLPSQSWDGPSKDGLVDCLNKCVSKDPNKFCINSESFLDVERQYQQAILRGFCNALKEKIDIDIEQILAFMRQIIDENKFWNEQYKKDGYNYRRWMISQISEFVSDVLRDKDLELEKNFLNEIKNILLLLEKRTKSIKPSDGRLIDSYINDSRGKAFEALIEYSWQYARRFKKDEIVRWEEDVKSVFEKGLDKKDDWCLYLTLGRYLPQFMRFDNDWTERNISRFFPMDDFNMWKVSFAGYLNIHTLYTELFDLMKGGGHYRKAIATDFEDEWTNEYLVQSISLAYMLGLENLEENSLMTQLVSRNSSSQLGEIVNYIWSLREKEYEGKSIKVINLWRKLFGIFKNHGNDHNYHQMIINVSEWLGLVDQIDEEIEEWVKFSLDQVYEAWELHFFIENLQKHVPREPKRVADIYIYILKRQKYPDFPKDQIIDLVDSLYLKGITKEANIICNQYLNTGHQFLVSTFQKYQQ